MKKSVLLFFFLACLIQSRAQLVTKSASAPAMQAFGSSRVFALLTGDQQFDEWYQAAVQRVWTVSAISFAPATALDSLVVSDKNFFLFAQAKDDRSSIMHLLNSDDITKKKEFIVVLSQGGYKQSKLLFTPALTGPKIIGSFRFSPERAELTAGMVECEMLIALLNQSVQIILERNIKTEVKDSVKYVISDGLANQIADKTLLINKAYNDGSISLEDKPLISDKVLSDYPYPYELTEKASLENQLSGETESFCYLFFYFPSQYIKVSEDSGDILIYDPAQKKFLYFEDNMDGPWFEKWKMKDMVYAIRAK
ncbi:MAG: hypothetical protein JST18_04780 [Bacteroidetes bacterium]|nr:hypothetical protein [Bacteroidota bacterium]